jgi:hypothetical protein
VIVAMATVVVCVRPMDWVIMAVVTVVIASGLVLIRFHPLTTGLNAGVESFWAAPDKSAAPHGLPASACKLRVRKNRVVARYKISHSEALRCQPLWPSRPAASTPELCAFTG